MYSFCAMGTIRYILPLELTETAKAAEAEIRKSIEQVEGAYLVRRHVAIFHIEEDGIRAELTANELIGFFSYLHPRDPRVAESFTREGSVTPAPTILTPSTARPLDSARAGGTPQPSAAHKHLFVGNDIRQIPRL